MGTIKIEPPLLGLSDNEAFSDQPPRTSRDAKNVRSVDPKTQRRRLSQRAGLSKFVTSAVDGSTGSKITRIDTVSVHDPQVTYAEHADGAINAEWSNVLPSKGDCLGGVVDRQSNVYALDGNSGVIKYNSKGTEVFRIALPTKDPNHLVRAIFIDPFDELYFAVSEGGDQKKARLWKYIQLPDDEVELFWEIETKAYVERVKTFKDKLYTIQNDTSQRRAFLVVYDGLALRNPYETQRWEIAHPAHDFDIGEDGAVFVASGLEERDANVYVRGPNPKSPTTFPTTVDWTPLELDQADRRIWSWYDAEEVSELDVAGEFRDQQLLVIWRDKSGNGRHLAANPGDANVDSGPRLTLSGLAGKPVLSFSGDEGLVSGTNPGTSEKWADQQRTMIPMYDDGDTTTRGVSSMFCLFLVIRPVADTPSGMGALNRIVFHQHNVANVIPGGGNTAEDHVLVANRNSLTVPSLADDGHLEGSLYWHTRTDATDPGDAVGGGGGINNQPLHAPEAFDNESSASIVTILFDGGVNPNDASTTATRSLWRVNGRPIDRFEGRGNASVQATYVGSRNPNGSVGVGALDYLGDIAEILCLVKYQDTIGSEVIEHQKFPDGSSGEDQAVNEMTLIEGYLAHKWGLAHLLEDDSDTWPHPFGITGGARSPLGPPPDGATGNTAQQALSYPVLIKYDSGGKLVWAYNNNISGADTGTDGGGVGWGVRVFEDGTIYSVGPTSKGNGIIPDGTFSVRRLQDLGETVSDDSADGAWKAALTSNRSFDYFYPRLDVDKFGNLYVPYFETGAAAEFSLIVFQEAGSSGVGVKKASFLLADSQQAHAVVIDPLIPDYLNSGVEIAEYVYLFTRNESDPTIATVHKVELVSKTKTTGSPRTTVVLAAARDGDIKKIDRAGDTVSSITGGGAGTLSANAQFVDSAAAFERIFFTDGESYKLYDARAGHDEIVEWKAESAGQLPERGELLKLWNGRLVIARFADDPQTYFMTKQGDPFDADLFPLAAGLVPGQAVAGTSEGGAGRCPDVINAICPVTDDVLLFGCDHSIWAMRGDPTQGGSFDKISDSVGMAFGRSWCKDDAGNVYFFGSRGGLYMVFPNGALHWLSENTIDARLQEIDFSAFHVELVYNHEDHGVHIFQIPFALSATTAEKHWFFEIRKEVVAPWEDKFGTNTASAIQPTAAAVLDGDEPDDRVLVLGCNDSRLRVWDRDAKDDDGTAIDSYATIGPLVPMNQHKELRFTKLQVELADDQQGALWELFANQEADEIGLRKRSGRLLPGVSPFFYERTVGPNAYLRLRNANAGERWSLENGTIDVFPAGRRRIRTG